jgi:hypothetical protein
MASSKSTLFFAFLGTCNAVVSNESALTNVETYWACGLAFQELLSNLVFEFLGHVVIWTGFVASITSLNVTPVMTLAR